MTITKGNICIIIVILLLATTIIVAGILLDELMRNCDWWEGKVDLKNSTCKESVYIGQESVYIGRKVYLHKCVKENKTVYDLRYFWKDDDMLKADRIGVQMWRDEFKKLCNFCRQNL